MNSKYIMIAMALASLGLNQAPAFADTVTKVTTTTISDGSVLTLPSGNYVLIDPVTGLIKGDYDPVRGFVSGTMAPGWVVLDKSSNKVVAGFNSAGQLMALTAIPAFNGYIVNISSRRAEMERLITSALERGKIDASQAADLRLELNSIQAQETAYTASRNYLTYDEALSIGVRLNALNDRLGVIDRSLAFKPLVGTTYVTTNGDVVTARPAGWAAAKTVITPTSATVISTPAAVVTVDKSDISQRNALMCKRIDDEYAAGRLRNKDVAKLKERLSEVSSKQARYTRGGGLPEKKRSELSSKLDQIQSSMDERIAETNNKRSKIGLRVN